MAGSSRASKPYRLAAGLVLPSVIVMTSRRARILLALAVLLAVNGAVAAKLFGVEFSAYTGSVEGTFIAIARVMREHPFDWRWWPLWSLGMPFENAYLPFEQWLVAGWSALAGVSPARSFHMVTAASYALGAPALFAMALALSRKLAASFFAALAYSCISLAALAIPAVRVDAGGALHLRRLQALVAYGEAPHTVALALLPLAVLCFDRALSTRQVKWNLAAGAAAAAVVLSNAFGIVALGLALVCRLAAFRPRPLWRAAVRVAVIGLVAYCWTAPWLSPSMLRAILNAQNVDGDYRYRPVTWLALALSSAGFVLLWWALGRARAAPALQFFLLYGYSFTVIVGLWYAWGIALLPQPHRYQLEMDFALGLALAFAAASLAGRLPVAARGAVAAVALAALGAQSVHSIAYARGLIRSMDRSQMPEFRIARWMDEHRHGERAFIGDSAVFLYNVFTDNPQIHGGHNQFEVNSFMTIVDFTVYTDTNAGDRAAEYSIFWLKAFGAHAIAVSGPDSAQHYKAFAHPYKFDGVLPLLWREGGDSIYRVPGRSPTLAHVIPASAVVARRPAHGLDTAPAAAYVAALDDPRFPVASWEWKGMSEAAIHATVDRGQVVAVQETYDPGWEAWANGRRLPIRKDALGLMVIEPQATGDSEIDLRYTGGAARTLMRVLSLLAMLVAAGYASLGRTAPLRSRLGMGPQSEPRP